MLESKCLNCENDIYGIAMPLDLNTFGMLKCKHCDIDYAIANNEVIGIIFGSFAHPKTYEEKLSFSCFKIENENSSINKYVITFDCNEEVISEVICGDLKEPIRYYYKKALNVKLLS